MDIVVASEHLVTVFTVAGTVSTITSILSFHSTDCLFQSSIFSLINFPSPNIFFLDLSDHGVSPSIILILDVDHLSKEPHHSSEQCSTFA